MTKIGSYTLTTDFTNAGGGQCRWAFATKDDKEYFIKEFLSPIYPVPGAPGSAKTKRDKLKECELFEARHNDVKRRLDKVSKDGNLVLTREFFRNDTKYYKTTDKIDVTSISIDEIHKEPFEIQCILALAALFSVQTLHNVGLVHGDLKPANILIKRVKEKW